jgi:hypothetical protein
MKQNNFKTTLTNNILIISPFSVQVLGFWMHIYRSTLHLQDWKSAIGKIVRHICKNISKYIWALKHRELMPEPSASSGFDRKVNFSHRWGSRRERYPNNKARTKQLNVFQVQHLFLYRAAGSSGV